MASLISSSKQRASDPKIPLRRRFKGYEAGSARFVPASTPCSAMQHPGSPPAVAPIRHLGHPPTWGSTLGGWQRDKTCHGCDTCTWLSDTAAIHLVFLQRSGRAPRGRLCDTALAFFSNVLWESMRDYEQSCCHDVSNGRHGFVYGQCLLRPGAA
jgi:hypothetical protein